MLKNLKIILIAGLLLISALAPLKADQDMQNLAKQAQNPVAPMISVPFQSNFYFGMGENNKMGYLMNIQPVVPFRASKNWNLITRTILPVVYLPPMGGRSNYGILGLGDLNPSFFWSPATPGKIIWGAGPTFTFPTATNTALGAGKFSAGPAAVALKMQGPWVYGVLINNQWSFAGDAGRAQVNQMTLQPFINYNLPKGWYICTSPLMTANWKAAQSKDIWTVPLGLGFGRTFLAGKQAMNMSLQGYSNVSRPEGSEKWQLRLSVQFLFPEKP